MLGLARLYTKDYLRLLEAVFESKAAWLSAMQPIQMLDGVRENETAFSVKTNNTPVVIREYDTGANVAFGTGTSNSNRFGPRTEIKYTSIDVPYDYRLAIHEGLDYATVNENMDLAVMDRLEAQAQAQLREMNERIGAYIAASAGNDATIAAINEENVIEMFTSMSAFFVNSEVIAPVSVFVTPAVYNQLLISNLMTTDKNSATNIDTGVVGDGYAFGFAIFNTPAQYFDGNDVMYFIPDGILLPFVGINIARTFESEDFAGVALQALAKGGTFVSEANATVISKVTLTP